jgi:hypothetical protein
VEGEVSDYRCDRCGWDLRGQFIETDIEPSFLGVASDETLIAYAETDHLLKTGCMGSLVKDTSFVDCQTYWMFGRRGRPLSKLPVAEQAEILGGYPIEALLPSRR